MIPSTIQQLSVVDRKAAKLEQQVSTHIESLKAAKAEQEEASSRVVELRRLLDAEELRADRARVAHEKAEAALRHSAGEYRRAQQLQKRLSNTLKELQGFNRSIVLMGGGGAAAIQVSSNADDHQGKANSLPPTSIAEIKAADSCTIHVPSMRKTIVVDSVVTPNTSMNQDQQLASDGGITEAEVTINGLLVPSLVSDALSGTNISVLTIGPKGAGKSSSTWGVMKDEPGSAKRSGGLGGGNRSLNISPQNSATQGAIGDPTGFLLSKYFHGFDSYFGLKGKLQRTSQISRPMPTDSEAPSAIVPLFIHHLFTHFQTYDVTHFNVRITFVELVADGTVDLFVVPGHAMAGALPESATMPIGFGGVVSDTNGFQRADASSVYMANQRAMSMQIKTEEEFYESLRHAFANRTHRLAAKHRAASDGQPRGRRSGSAIERTNSTTAAPQPQVAQLEAHKLADLYGGHLAMSIHIENFNARGNFRRSTVLFTDIAGGLTVGNGGGDGGSASGISAHGVHQTSDQLWAAKGAWALTDVISMASAASTSASTGNVSNVAANLSYASSAYQQTPAHASLASFELPHKSNRLVQLVREGFGGNAKGVLCCVVPRPASDGKPEQQPGGANPLLIDSLNALAYAHYFKNIGHNAVPLDIPPELQRLTREVGQEEGEEGNGHYDRFSDNDENSDEDEISQRYDSRQFTDANRFTMAPHRV